MMVLGIETSSAVCSVGLANDTGPIDCISMSESHIHSEKLQVLTNQLLEQHGVAFGQLDAVAISAGPGSFTGLRIGMSSAKGLAFGLGIPLVSVSTFDAVAERWKQTGGRGVFSIAVDAKQGEFYTARYQVNSDGWQRLLEISVAPLEGVAKHLVPGTTLTTDRVELFADVKPREFSFVDYASLMRADVVAVEGLRQLRRGGNLPDLASAEPMYLKEFVVKPAC
ncbi:MAG: tRNA (adenosine(37)-N6)-threonylcarbamoyltransferase complex dimerization subunit type 1 TsaB [Ignavibacteriales bacterium]|nr:tRNA (adenosine(37)-N6)-threonylcarbamoyltransferase complex dimerization subunit type 1 TsaB [Ignavibacteriales bacterium]